MSTRERNRLNQDDVLPERRRAHEKLRASEIRYRRLFEAARDGILIVDASTRKITDVNPFLVELLGYPRHEFLGKELWEIGLLQDAQASQAAFRQLQETGYIRYEHLPLQTREGVRREVEFISNVYGQDGQPVIQCNIRDITGRKEAERALRSSEERANQELLELEQVYRTSPVGLCFVNTALCYLRVNQRLAAIHGAAVAEHLRRPIRDVLPTLADQIEPHFRQVIGSGQPLVEQEVHGVTPAEPQRERDLLASYYPVQGPDGAVLGVSAAVQEVTERKRFEAQLRHTQKLESLGVLAGGVAHDFNNLLTGILGNAGLALNTLVPSHPGRARLEQVMLASQRAAELTNQLLAYSGRGHFLIRPVGFSELVREVSQLIRTSVPKTVELRLELREELPPVEADASQLQQLVMNLVLNAAEAVGQGSGTVRVRTGLQQVSETYLRETFVADRISPGPYVYLEVQDSGCGMAEEVRSKIFDPFFTTKLTGRGLGLAAVLGIVRGHRGAIQVDSAPGQGTTFKVLLPAAAGQRVELKAASPPPDVTGTGTLLVVDDEELVRRLAQDVLEGCGYQVVLAANGREAVELFRQRAGQITGVLLDLTMPVMGGEEALRRLKEIRPEVRVVLSSGYDELDAVQRFAGEGLAEFIQKPYTPAALAAKIKKALSSLTIPAAARGSVK